MLVIVRVVEGLNRGVVVLLWDRLAHEVHVHDTRFLRSREENRGKVSIAAYLQC